MTQAACHGHAAGATCGDFQVSGGDEGRDLSAGERGCDIPGLLAAQEEDTEKQSLLRFN